MRGIVRKGRSARKRKRNHENRGDRKRQDRSKGERELKREKGRKSVMKRKTLR
jgi:hypothetical protein